VFEPYSLWTTRLLGTQTRLLGTDFRLLGTQTRLLGTGLLRNVLIKKDNKPFFLSKTLKTY
jgi:hypothetical protein